MGTVTDHVAHLDQCQTHETETAIGRLRAMRDTYPPAYPHD